MTTSPTPRPGSAIWQRVDGGSTGLRWLPSGSANVQAYVAKADAEALIAADLENPGGLFIFDGDVPDDGSGGFEVERYDVESVLRDEAIVLSPTKPPFGEWRRRDTWPDPPGPAHDFGDRPWPPRP